MATIATSMPAAGTDANESRLLMASTGEPRHPGLLHDKHMLVCQEVLVLALFFQAWQHNKFNSKNMQCHGQPVDRVTYLAAETQRCPWPGLCC